MWGGGISGWSSEAGLVAECMKGGATGWLRAGSNALTGASKEGAGRAEFGKAGLAPVAATGEIAGITVPLRTAWAATCQEGTPALSLMN